MACPPGNCAAWGAFRLCKPLPPIVIDGSYSPDELQLLWFCWRARSTGEYGGSTPVDLGFNSPGLIDISKTTNLAQVIAYCESRGTLVRQFTNFSRFGVKFNLPNYKASGSFNTWSGGVFGGATSPGGGGGEDSIGGGGGGGTSGGSGAATCEGCDDSSGLAIKVCTNIDCDDPSPKVEITACGGVPPYSWSLSGAVEEGVILTISGTNNRNAIAVPIDSINDFEGVTSYAKYTMFCTTDDDCLLSANTNGINWRNFDCDGVALGGCNSAADSGGNNPTCNGGRPY